MFRKERTHGSDIDFKTDSRAFSGAQDDWKARTRHLSNTTHISLVFSYQNIIGLGPVAVPLILEELKKAPDHWFWALEAITGENPVRDDDGGDLQASADAWIQWGQKNGHLK